MASERDNSPVQISQSDFNLEGLIETFVGDPEFRDRLQAAAVLIIPTYRLSEYPGPLFPDTTRDVLQCLQEGLGDIVVVDAAVRDEDYKPLALYSEELIIPALYIAHRVLLPLVINLLGAFIYEHLKATGGPKPQDNAKCEIHYHDANGKLLNLNYDGPANTLERVVQETLGGSEPPENDDERRAS